jgi:hypothetical protein
MQLLKIIKFLDGNNKRPVQLIIKLQPKMKDMKKALIFFSTSVIILSSSSCFAASENDSTEKQTLQMLKEFYTAYHTEWIATKTTKRFDILIKKIDSLERKYCSLSLRNKLKQEFKKGGLDNDLLTNNEGSDNKSLKTLTVIKDTTRINSYIVSYVYDTLSPSYKPITKEVVLHIKVIKEKGEFKIDSVW